LVPVLHHDTDVSLYRQDHPDINFLGLLIGPRGTTQKRMEADSGARILIRGRGSAKDGNDEDPDEDLHVLIVGDTEESVQRGSRMVSDLLFNRDEQAAVKNQQLRQVAEMKGSGQEDSRNLVLSSSLYAGDVDYPPFRGTGEVCRSVKVRAERVGQIIGRGGETIKMLQARTGAYIQVSREADLDPNFKTITIEGTEEQVKRGQEEIQRIIDDCDQRERERTQASGGSGQAGFAQGGAGVGFGAGEVIKIPSDTVGLLIGRGGQTIRQMQLRTGCNIQVQRDADADPSTGYRDVTLSGTPEQIQIGRAEIDRLVEAQATGQKAVPLDIPGMMTRVITVPNSMVGIVIGRGGETIKGIQARTGARVQVSKDATAPEREITLSGSDQAVQYAQHEIDQLVAPVTCPLAFL
jgi:far upstream element-binding protein